MDFLLTSEQLEKNINLFLTVLSEKGYSEPTCKGYRSALRLTFSYILTTEDSVYSLEASERFIHSELDALSVSKSYQKHIRSAVRRFNDYLSGKPYVFRVPNPKAALSNEYEELLNSYEQSMLKKKLHLSTIECRLIFARQFLCSLEKQDIFIIAIVTGQQVGAALLSINSQEGACKKLPYFLKYLFEQGKTAVDFSNIVPSFIEEKRLPTIYCRSELVTVLSGIDTSTLSGKRDYAIFLILATYGLRASDLTHLTISDIDFQNNYFSFYQSKTGEPYHADLIPAVSNALKIYIHEVQPVADNEPVFRSCQAPYGKLSRGAIWSIVSKRLGHAITVGDRKHGSHSIRSSLASGLISEDVPYAVVQQILGHADPNATKRYAAMDIEKLRMCSLECPEESGAFSSYLEGGTWK